MNNVQMNDGFRYMFPMERAFIVTFFAVSVKGENQNFTEETGYAYRTSAHPA